jgi:hypothetical protein
MMRPQPFSCTRVGDELSNNEVAKQFRIRRGAAAFDLKHLRHPAAGRRPVCPQLFAVIMDESRPPFRQPDAGSETTAPHQCYEFSQSSYADDGTITTDRFSSPGLWNRFISG